MTKEPEVSSKSEIASKPEGGTDKFDLKRFLAETRGELDRVVWPGRSQLIGESISVLLIVVASAILIYLVDALFNWLAGLIF